jgi:DNA-binding NtrC family response regulator
VVTIWLPPLAQRRDDIPALADYFLARHAAEAGIENPGLGPEAAALLQGAPWPGNVRELANTLQKALIFSRGAPLGIEDIAQAAEDAVIGAETPRQQVSCLRQWAVRMLTAGKDENRFERCMDAVASILVREALDLCGGNRSKAARLLGLSRPTLHAKIDKYGLRIESAVKED